jgi:hypothetical protein
MLHVPPLLNEVLGQPPQGLRISLRVRSAVNPSTYISTTLLARSADTSPFSQNPVYIKYVYMQAYANKIAVSTGNGSHYLKHTDNNTPEAVRVCVRERARDGGILFE